MEQRGRQACMAAKPAADNLTPKRIKKRDSYPWGITASFEAITDSMLFSCDFAPELQTKILKHLLPHFLRTIPHKVHCSPSLLVWSPFRDEHHTSTPALTLHFGSAHSDFFRNGAGDKIWMYMSVSRLGTSEYLE